MPHGHYSQSQVADDLQAIETLYQANGYPSVKATSQVIYDYQGTRGDVKLVVKVDEGPLVLVRQLEIRGAHAVSEEELRGLINTQGGAAVLRGHDCRRPGGGAERLLQPRFSVGADGELGEVHRCVAHVDGRGV